MVDTFSIRALNPMKYIAATSAESQRADTCSADMWCIRGVNADASCKPKVGFGTQKCVAKYK